MTNDDLVKRLRGTRYDKDNCPRMDTERVGTPALCEEAATRIQALEAEVARLKPLKSLVEELVTAMDREPPNEKEHPKPFAWYQRARQSLGDSDEG